MAPPPANGESASVRAFLALVPDPDTRGGLTRMREALLSATGTAPRGVRWVDPSNLHLTLRFLGATTAGQVERLARALPVLARPLPPLPARRCAIWPNRARPRMLVLELAADRTLSELADACDATARAAGHPPDPRAFRAHVTLARLRPGCPLALPPAPDQPLTFEAIALMQSRLGQPTATYTELARASLAAAERKKPRQGN